MSGQRLACWRAVASVGIAVATAGCGHFQRCPTCCPANCPSLPAASIPSLRWDISAAPSAKEARSAVKADDAEAPIGPAIDAEFCLLRACEACGVATLANSETKVGNHPFKGLVGPGAKKKDRLEAAILEQAAWEARNKQAAAALEALYRLAEVQAKSKLLLDNLERLEGALADARQIRAKGFTTDFESLAARRNEIWQAAHKLQAGEVALAAQLRTLLKLECLGPNARLIAVVDWKYRLPSSVDLCLHPELVFLTDLEADIDVDTLPVVRRYLRTINPLLGGAAAIPGINWVQQFVLRWLPPPSVKRELEARRRQVADYRGDRAGQFRAEIAARGAEIVAGGRRLAGESEAREEATQQAEYANRRLRDGGGSRIEAVLAKLVVVDAEQRLLSAIADTNIAHVKFRQAAGTLIPPPAPPVPGQCRHANSRGLAAPQAPSQSVEVIEDR